MRRVWPGSPALPVLALSGAAALCALLAGAPAAAWGAATETQARQRVEGAALQAEATRAVSGWLARQPVSRYEVSTGPTMADIDVPAAGPWSLSARPIAAGQAPVGRIIVWVDVQVAGRVERRVPVVVAVRSFALRWQARMDLPARAAVGPHVFERQEIELSLPYAAAAELPLGMRLSRALAAGQVLQAAHLEPSTEVTRGDMVDAHVRRGLVSVQTRGEALQDGRNGQRIHVRITGASGPVLARVVGPGTVQVNE